MGRVDRSDHDGPRAAVLSPAVFYNRRRLMLAVAWSQGYATAQYDALADFYDADATANPFLTGREIEAMAGVDE